MEHPSCFIRPDIVKAMRRLAPEAEQAGCLHPGQLELIYRYNWFNLFVPAIYNGLELSLPDALKIEEGLAWTDGSVGWTVTLCSGANWFAGFMEREITQQLFADKKVCLGGSGKPTGRAKVLKDGFEITGSWHYATGAAHATVFTANCLIEKNGRLLKNEVGDPLIQTFLLLRKEVTIHRQWDYIGMKATSSYSFEVNKLNVPYQRRFIIDRKHLIAAAPIYQYPFRHFAEATLAVNSSGMMVHFLDLYKRAKENQSSAFYKGLRQTARSTEAALQQMEQRFHLLRDQFYKTAEQSWEECIRRNNLTPACLRGVSKASRALARQSRLLMDALYPYCGLEAAKTSTEINRVWRDLHTISQHPLLLYTIS